MALSLTKEECSDKMKVRKKNKSTICAINEEDNVVSKKAVVVGSINMDITASCERLPRLGETVFGYSVGMFGGGKGANQAIQCAQMGLDTKMVGQVGTDMQGETVLASMKSKGIDCTYINVSDTVLTGCAQITVDDNGDNTLVYAPGANQKIGLDIIDKARAEIESADIFITQNEINLDAAIYALKIAHEAGVPTVLNPAPAMEVPEEIFSYVDYITPNETEAEVYTGILRSEMDIETWKKKTAEWFFSKGVKTLVITMGEKGVYYATADEAMSVPAFTIKAVDTTAAGDSFHGGFAYGVANGYDTKKALQFGNACGAMTSMGLGAQNSIQPYEKIVEFMAQNGVEV